jgi:predicted nucleic acid-binding protein
MKHLLDLNLLIAGIVQSQSRHGPARVWLSGKQIVLCPLVELGFLRISTNKKSAVGLTMDRTTEVLERFALERKADRIPDDLPAAKITQVKEFTPAAWAKAWAKQRVVAKAAR